MSLTRILNNPLSGLYQWLQNNEPASTNEIIALANQNLQHQKVIRPQGKIEDFGLLGTAAVYAYRWHLNLLAKPKYFSQTIAGRETPKLLANALLRAENSRQKAIACVTFAAYETKYRCGRVHPFCKLIGKDPLVLLPQQNPYLGTIDDLENLIESMQEIGADRAIELIPAKVRLNAQFAGSQYIAADAQQIIDGNLIKCFTTCALNPFNRVHLYQQIAYVLLDWTNRHKIQTITWNYLRQQTKVTYQVEDLVTNLSQKRQEFKAFIMAGEHNRTYSERTDNLSPKEISGLFGLKNK